MGCRPRVASQGYFRSAATARARFRSWVGKPLPTMSTSCGSHSASIVADARNPCGSPRRSDAAAVRRSGQRRHGMPTYRRVAGIFPIGGYSAGTFPIVGRQAFADDVDLVRVAFRFDRRRRSQPVRIGREDRMQRPCEDPGQRRHGMPTYSRVAGIFPIGGYGAGTFPIVGRQAFADDVDLVRVAFRFDRRRRSQPVRIAATIGCSGCVKIPDNVGMGCRPTVASQVPDELARYGSPARA
jgi:hypothetical protein